jgi:hypothetical protein
MIHMLARMLLWRDVSKAASPAGFEVRKGVICQSVQGAAFGILFELDVPTLGLECVKPRGKLSQFLWPKFRYGLFDLFQLGHG